MDLTKVRGCLAVSILPLLLLVDPTAACYCLDRPPISLQTAYCVSDVVISGIFVDSRFADENDMTWAIYEFKVTKVFKGSIAVGKKVDLYTQVLGTTCAYRHDGPLTEDPYVIAGLPFLFFVATEGSTEILLPYVMGQKLDKVNKEGGPSLPLQALLSHFSFAMPVDNWDLTNYRGSPGCRFALPCQTGIPELYTWESLSNQRAGQ